MDARTFGALSVAQYVSFRKLTPAEIQAIQDMDPEMLWRVSKIMHRLSFIEELRYSVPLDYRDTLECSDRDALEIYLLCTCLDTLAGDKYHDFQSWLTAKPGKANIAGVSDRDELIREYEENQSASEVGLSKLLKGLVEAYNEHFGVNRNIRKLVQKLPEEIRVGLAKAYMIEKSSAHGSMSTWQGKTLEEQLKTIFVDYLFDFRRNKYTHSSEQHPHFGGICFMRRQMEAGLINLPNETTLQFPKENGKSLIVTCHYGDEALFLCEAIVACLANELDVLEPGWIDKYRNAEQQKRTLYALINELRHNIQMMQLHLQVLLGPTYFSPAKAKGYPQLRTGFAQQLVDENRTIRLPISEEMFLRPYIRAALDFNYEMQKTGAGKKEHWETTSGHVNAIMMDTGIRHMGQLLGRHCDRLLEDYPVWTYDPYYFPG